MPHLRRNMLLKLQMTHLIGLESSLELEETRCFNEALP